MRKTESLQEIAIAFVTDRSEAAFTKLYHRLKPGLTNLVMKYHQDEDTVSEILSITLSKAYTFVDLYDSRWNYSTWVYKICQNECLMELRRKNSLYNLDTLKDFNSKTNAVNRDDWIDNAEFSDMVPDEGLESHDAYVEIMKVISLLPDQYREILHDREIHKLKYEEIAEKRNMKINTVRSRIHVAKKLAKNKWIEIQKQNTDKKSIHIKNVAIVKLDQN